MLALVPLLLAFQSLWQTDLLAGDDAWKARPDWVGEHAAETYSADPAAGALALRVASSRMKWVRAGRFAPRELAPWLVLRYRASGLGGTAQEGDYFLWLEESGAAGRPLIQCADLASDGAWRTLGLNLGGLGAPGNPSVIALQVIAGDGPAEVEIAELRFAAAPPPDAELHGALAASSQPPVEIPLPAPDKWSVQPSWLANPGPGLVEAANEGVRFTSLESGRGVKWSAPLAEPCSLTGHPYAVLRYRALGGAASDYAVCVMGEEAYATLVSPTDLQQDGAVHIVCVPLGPAAETVPTIERLAVQVQARRSSAWFEVLGLTLASAPEMESLADSLLPISRIGAGWRSVGPAIARTKPDAAPDEAEAVLRAAGLRFGGPLGEFAAYRDVPFDVSDAARAPIAPFGSRADLSLPVQCSGTELYLLAAVGLIGDDQPARGGRLRSVPDADRFVIELLYDGTDTLRCVPSLIAPNADGEDAWGLARGLCLLRCPLDPERGLTEARLRVWSDQIGLCLLGATVRTGGPLHSSPEDVFAPLPPRDLAPAGPPHGDVGVRCEGPSRIAETPEVRAVFALTRGGFDLTSLRCKALDVELLAESPQPLLTVRVDGQVASQIWTGTDRLTGTAGDLVLDLELDADARFGAGFTLSVRNKGETAHRVEVLGPSIRLRMPGPGEPAYCFPDAAAVVSERDGSYSAPYAGWGVRHQFLAASTADAAAGVALTQPGTEPIERAYQLSKDGPDIALGVSYPERDLAPGESRVLPPTYLGAYAGDWHVALERYRAWYAGALPPAGPRPAWFRRVWNFRQRFLHWLDPLWPDHSKPIDLTPALDEAERQFGGAEYLHIFDWGNVAGLGRVYGRPGDPDPADAWPGGYPAMREAIAAVRARGAHVGLYIEGYLLETKGPLGQRLGDVVAIRDQDGKARFWPDATEVFACPAVEEWRAIQAETYRKAVSNMQPDGMYVDQFGFCSDWRTCCATTHGHPVPGNMIADEAGMLRALREAVDGARHGVAIYSEESPPDVNAPLQDGSFTYSMQRALGAGVEVPLNLCRFVIPSFKTIEILVCDKPTADWAAGPAWVFFNGEAIWLEGEPEEWFAPETREMIRRWHAVLKAHEDAFASEDVIPLAPTLADGVYANRFVGPIETVYTLYNARHTSYSGPVLALPNGFRGVVTEAVTGRELPVACLPEGAPAVSLDLDPLSVGCVVVR